MLASTGLAEEGVEGVITSTNGLVRGHLTIRLDPMFQTIELPAGIANLDSSLANMNGDTFTLAMTKIVKFVMDFIKPYKSLPLINSPVTNTQSQTVADWI